MRKSGASAKGKRSRKSAAKPRPAKSRARPNKRSELADLQAMMTATLESTTDAIVLTDGAAKVTGYNQKYAELLRLSPRKISQMGVQELREIFSRQFKNPEKFIADTKAIYAAGLSETFDEIEFVDGRIFERYSKLQKIDDRTIGRVWSFRDITERRRGVERLRAAKIDAERASKAKDDFLSLLSHELRTPLTPALAAASYLAEHEDLLPAFRKEINAVLRNVQLEARLIDDLLDVTRIARGKIELRRQVVDAHALVRDALDVARKDIREKELVLTLQADAMDHYVQVDPVRIRQVLWNLINNAVKFTEPGGRIDVRTSNDGRAFVFEISDNGIGIEADKRPNIFKAFEQGEASVARQFGGLGLGLAISKTLLDLHGGTISVQSDGKYSGATFRATLQIVPAPLAPDGNHDGNAPGVSRRLQLLLVDDHADTREVLSRLLQKCGHKVAAVECVHDALHALTLQTFDALISDIGLPDSTGYELVRMAKQRQSLKGIALSGFGMEQDVRRSREAGFDYHLTKPVSFQDLRDLLQKVLE